MHTQIARCRIIIARCLNIIFAVEQLRQQRHVHAVQTGNFQQHGNVANIATLLKMR